MPTYQQLVKLHDRVNKLLPLGSDNKPNTNEQDFKIQIANGLINLANALAKRISESYSKEYEFQQGRLIRVTSDGENKIVPLEEIQMKVFFDFMTQATLARYAKVGRCGEITAVCVSEFILDPELEGSVELVD